MWLHFTSMLPMPIAIRQLKAELSRVLARATAGEVIEVTSHNKPIARIVGIPPHAGQGLRGLLASGALCWSGGKPQLQPPLALAAHGTPVSRMVVENRG
jgi:prevent-host-death family protein